MFICVSPKNYIIRNRLRWKPLEKLNCFIYRHYQYTINYFVKLKTLSITQGDGYFGRSNVELNFCLWLKVIQKAVCHVLRSPLLGENFLLNLGYNTNNDNLYFAKYNAVMVISKSNIWQKDYSARKYRWLRNKEIKLP